MPAKRKKRGQCLYRSCDALHQHFLDLAYDRLRDPESRAILEEFLEKTHLFLARKKRA